MASSHGSQNVEVNSKFGSSTTHSITTHVLSYSAKGRFPQRFREYTPRNFSGRQAVRHLRSSTMLAYSSSYLVARLFFLLLYCVESPFN